MVALLKKRFPSYGLILQILYTHNRGQKSAKRMMFIERKNPSLCMALPEGQTLFLDRHPHGDL